MMELTIEELGGGVACAVLTGRFDSDGAAVVDPGLRKLASVTDHLIVDLSGVSFLASLGLRTLVVCARTVATRGGRMAISAPQPAVGRVLAVSGLDNILKVKPSIDAALAVVI
jgi:anti-anti-sigma factor